MRRLSLAIIAIACLSCVPALAGEWVHCADGDGHASFDYLRGDGQNMLSVSALTITAGDRVWASDPANGPGDPVFVGQGFEDTQTVRIDATDAQRAARIAELRLFRTVEGSSAAVYGGTLRIPGMGAWAVSCNAG